MSGLVEPETLRDKLKAQLPADLKIKSVTLAQPGQKIKVKAARYEITCEKSLDFMNESLQEKVSGGLQSERKGKRFLLRDFLEDFKAAGNKISFTLKLGETGTPTVSETLAALGITKEISGPQGIVRTGLIDGR